MPKRNEMDPRYQWDFTHIYPDAAAWQAAYDEAEAAVPAIKALEGTLTTSPQALADGLDKLYALLEKVEKVGVYAFLHKTTDGGDPANQEMEGKATNLEVAFSAAAAFIDPEILTLSEETLQQWLAEEPRLATYRHTLEDTLRGRAHTLDAEKERMLAMLGDAAQTPSEAFGMLHNVDMVFPTVKDDEGKEVQLTNGNFTVYRESTQRSVRQAAFENYFGEHLKYNNTNAALYAGCVKMNTYAALQHKHEGPRSKALFGNNVPLSVYDSLIDAIHESLPAMKEYLELRRRTLGVEELDMYDLYVPMVGDADFAMPFEQGKVLVKEALKPLGEDYQKLLDEAYANKWMDVYENQGKRSGAFSCGVYGVHPYVLLNYTDTLDDAFTMAHELGHAMHSYLSSEKQDFVNHDYRILVAEVASTVNEVLLTLHLLKTETDKKRRAYILNHFLEGFRTTVFRQTLFAEFERETHAMYQAGKPLTAQSLNDLYKDLLSTYYQGIRINDLMKVEWSYIPHFYRAFYVYQYATGFCSAVAIARRIVETGDASGYLKFLSLGGSDYPLEELKVAGVDLTKPDAVRSAMELFRSTIGELDELLKEL